MEPLEPNLIRDLVSLLFLLGFAWVGWDHFRRAEEICEDIATGMRWVPFLARLYRSRACCWALKLVALLGTGFAFFVFCMLLARMFAR